MIRYCTVEEARIKAGTSPQICCCIVHTRWLSLAPLSFADEKILSVPYPQNEFSHLLRSLETREQVCLTCVVLAVVEPLAAVIHTELHLFPDVEKYVNPRIALAFISNNVCVSLRTCQVFASFHLLVVIWCHWFGIDVSTAAYG